MTCTTLLLLGGALLLRRGPDKSTSFRSLQLWFELSLFAGTTQSCTRWGPSTPAPFARRARSSWAPGSPRFSSASPSSLCRWDTENEIHLREHSRRDGVPIWIKESKSTFAKHVVATMRTRMLNAGGKILAPLTLVLHGARMDNFSPAKKSSREQSLKWPFTLCYMFFIAGFICDMQSSFCTTCFTFHRGSSAPCIFW